MRLARVLCGLLFRAIYGVRLGWDGLDLTGSLADKPPPAVFIVILCVCFSFPYFATLYVCLSFSLTITELDEGQSEFN